jgi:hypothetical protein
MPIALHPDPLISIILPAAAYPVEIVQAARFVKDTNNLSKVDQQPWDENVKAVAKFPDLIAKMDADLGWTVALGQAFVDQPKELMDTIQALRAKAQKAGTLQSTPQQIVSVTNVVVVQTNVTQVVTVTNQVVQIQPSNPQVVYVPTYPPTVYYPPPTYVYNPVAPLVTFGVGMAMGAIIANNCDWHGGCVWVGGGGAVWVGGGGDVDVDIDIDRNTTINRNTQVTAQNRAANPSATATGQKWQPDQKRMATSGAGGASASTMESRGWSSGAARPSTQPAGGARPSTGTPSASRPAASPSVSRPAASPSVSRPAPSPSPSVSRPSGGSGGSAFGGVSSGSASRSYSSRGATSRSGGFSGGGARGGGGRR